MSNNEKVYHEKKNSMLDTLIQKCMHWGNKNNVVVEKVGNFKRLFAYFIDFYIASVLASIPLVYIISIVTGKTDFTNDLTKLPINYAYLSGVLAILMYSIYYVVIPSFTNGQTLGKKLMGFRVVRNDDKKVTVCNLIRRELVGVMLVEGYLAASSTYLQQLLQILFHVNLSEIYTYVYGALTVLSIMVAMMSPYRKMFHDYIGGTKVIPVHSESNEHTAF